jgi:hypothetical protein
MLVYGLARSRSAEEASGTGITFETLPSADG